MAFTTEESHLFYVEYLHFQGVKSIWTYCQEFNQPNADKSSGVDISWYQEIWVQVEETIITLKNNIDL